MSYSIKTVSDDAKLSINRFIEAQNDGGAFDRALMEIRNGKKVTHWIWFVFPQLRELGKSSISRFYGIINMSEAKAYLRNRFLRNHLRLIINALLTHSGLPAIQILGQIDAMKLWSCITLFLRAAELKSDCVLFKRVLDAFFGGKEETLTVKILECDSENA